MKGGYTHRAKMRDDSVIRNRDDLRRRRNADTFLAMLRTLLFPGAVLAAVAASSLQADSVPGPGADRRTVPHALSRDSVAWYTEEQAVAGQAVYAKVCSECHESKDVNGADFRAKWSGQTVFALYELIRTTMPDGNPGSLSAAEYASTVAYILKLNKLPAGSEALGTDSVSLAAKKLDLPAQ